MIRQPEEWGVFVRYTSGRGLVSKNFKTKQNKKLYIKKINNNLKWDPEPRGEFSEDELQMAEKHFKNLFNLGKSKVKLL